MSPGELALAAHNILANSVTFMFMVPLGISISATTMIGNLLGARDPNSARRVSLSARIAIVTTAAVYSVGFLFGRRYVPYVRLFATRVCVVFCCCTDPVIVLQLFTSNLRVLDETASLLILGAPFMILDAFQYAPSCCATLDLVM
jgi:Na+-driven multidrug efflux pump